MEHRLFYINVFSVVLCIATSDIRHSKAGEQGSRWSHGCRGIPGLNQTVNTLRCPLGCTIAIHQVTYGTKNRPGCPYEISHHVEPHCCYREATDDCYQNKSQKIPMLQLLCREATHVCQLSVDRVAIRCPRNAFSISTMRSIRYSCICATPPSTSTAQTQSTDMPQTVTETVKDPFPPTTLGASAAPSSHSSANTTWLPRSDGMDNASTELTSLSRSQILSTVPSIGPLKLGTSVSTGESVDSNESTRMVTVDVHATALPIQPSTSYFTSLTDTTTTTTPWTLTAENHPTQGLTSSGTVGHGLSLPSDGHLSAGGSLNGTLLGGVIGGAVMIFLISILAVVILCVRRKRRKSEAQGTEEASQYAYEFMDISLRRPQPVVTHVSETTSRETAEEAHDINLEGQATQGTFLEKQIQRYLITSIYAEIKDFKRLSQESGGNVNAQCDNKVKVKPTPKPRKLCDLYAKVNKRDKGKPGTNVTEKTEYQGMGQNVSNCNNKITIGKSTDSTDPRKSDGYDDIYSTCADPPMAKTAGPSNTGPAKPTLTLTYDRLMSCDTTNGQNERTMDRVASGPYDELYTEQDEDTIRGIRYFNNSEYATLNFANGQNPTLNSRSNSDYKDT